MLSIQRLREQTAEVRRSCVDRGVEVSLDRILELDEHRRSLLVQVEGMRADRNRAGKEIGAAVDNEQRQRLIRDQRALSGKLDQLEHDLTVAEDEIDSLLLGVPNICHEDVPLGAYEDSVIVIEGDGGDTEERRIDPPRRVGHESHDRSERDSKSHWDIGQDLGLIDFERGVKISGSHFYILRDQGARLQRALITWMLDMHREQGYSEVYPPALVKPEALVGTGQLPKFADTMFRTEGSDLWLIPTAEVPVTNMYRDEILDTNVLPILHSAYSPCFRDEQFSAGREVRGLKRGYQFDKVELVRFVEPEQSWTALEELLKDALSIVRALGFRYRVLRLASTDLTFASSMTYDIELWAPGCGEWLEVSSVSNFMDFQSRRANLRYRDNEGVVSSLHTLNGSALALPRTMATLLETYQRDDGSVAVPQVLRSYMGGLEVMDGSS